ncbi:MAG: hypothetical protein Q4D37_07275 [Oscillospiraceae bacterium]|nr:hypothetical protein [Oscillospiraceae bacterium]
MKKQLLHTYRFVFICMLAAVIVLCFAAGYSVRVLDQNRVIQQVDVNMDAAKVRLDRDAEETASLMENLRNEYASKTRVVAMLLEEQTDLSENETILEELRVVIEAEQISISNETGLLIASTDFSSTGKRLQSPFLSHATDPVFTDVLFTMQNDAPTIIAASALGTGKGLVQVQYPAESMLAQSQEMDVSTIVVDMPFYDTGISAIIDAETGKYVSHTQPERCDTYSEYDMRLFSAKKGKFDLMQQHQRHLIRYQTYDDYILLFSIPYQQMNNAKGTVLNWVIATGLILLLVAVLSMRMGYLYLQKNFPDLFPKRKI